MHVGTDIDFDEDEGEELLSVAHHYELRPQFPTEDTFEAWVTHVFTLDIGFSLNRRTSERNLDALDEMVENALAELLPDFDVYQTPDVWLLVEDKPSLYINGLRMLRQGCSPDAVKKSDLIQRGRLPASYAAA